MDCIISLLKNCNWLFMNEKFTSHSFCSEMGDIQINLEKPEGNIPDSGEVKGDLNIDPDLDRLVWFFKLIRF